MDGERTGVGEYTFGLLDSLFKIDRENQFFLFYNSSKDVLTNLPKWKYDNVHYVGMKWPNKFLNLLVWLKLVKLDKLVSRKYKVKSRKSGQTVNCKLGTMNLDIWFSPNLNFTNLSKHVKHIQTIHDLSFEFFPEFFTWKQRLWHWFLSPKKQCQEAEIVVVPSESTKWDICEVYKVHQVHKVIKLQPGVSPDYGLLTIDYSQKGKYILYLGTLEPRKNVESIIRAYKFIYDLGFMIYDLVIAGSSGWKNKKLMRLIENTPGVKYLGYVDEAEKKALFKNTSLFIFPSFYEGFGLPVLEAMAEGVPVITANRSSLTEVVGDAAYLVNPHNVKEIAIGIKLILSDNKLSDMLGERGKKQAEKFGWGKTAQEFVNLINKNG
jgi:glycosyltransferase involved in cell wall biosynthesis